MSHRTTIPLEDRKIILKHVSQTIPDVIAIYLFGSHRSGTVHRESDIDLAMYLNSIHRLGAPQSSREAFELLMEADLLEQRLGFRLQRMVGFRNISIHAYQEIDIDIVLSIVHNHLADFLQFTEVVLQTNGFRN